ncbi:tyrosine-protein kinase TXK-like isoform X2 [Penaeus chinensis]|uniref:tyrosine-protein kinase TXK-like isoform X2 n=2 Tax=Penaeus TaxID=133894 RepID=UPI001FB828FC|nr:tyrosine-protein kinase TXK-like isoform X2 [Penaeus chinensis]
MKEEMGGVATHAEALRALNLQPPRISSHLDLLTDPLAPLRAPSHTAAAHARVSAARSLRGAFHARLNGPLASLQAPTAHRANTASTRSPRAVKRLSARSSRAPRARSQPTTDKENVLGLEEEEDEGFEDVWGAGREDSRPISSGRDANAADNSWAGDITRLSSALDQLAALCNATQRSPHENPTSLPLSDSALSMSAAHSSLQPFHHHHQQYPLHNPAHHPPPNPIPTTISPTCPVHGSGAMHASLVNPSSGDGFFPHQESDSGGSSGGHVASTPPSPTTGSGGREFAGMARKVGVALRALGGRLAAWSRGADGSQGSSQLSSSSSSSSSPVAGRHSGHPTPSPTPPNGLPSDMNPVNPGGGRLFLHPHERAPKIVVALYDYNATERGDLSLRKNEEFEVLEQDQEHWWKMRNRQTGMEGFAPSNYVRELGTPDIQQYDWYLGDATRQRAEVFLMQQEREGCFVVRNSTTNSGVYTLSVYTKQSHPQVKHYHIKKDPEGNYYLSQNIKCKTIPELIYRHQHNPGGICARLRPPTLGRTAPATAGLSHDKWEIDPSELNLLEELGSGQFGVVRHGKLKSLDVAVKMMKEGTMSEDEFIEEAKVMTKLRHGNLVQLYGVCSRQRPIYIVTEYLRYGSLLQYLRNKERILLNNTDVLLDMCLQVCSGMAYLEKQKFIHRDLAARNCLVGAHNEIKVGDFGLARYVVDDEYTGSGGAKFPIKWAAPEVLNFMRFSSKSDVWAFGVLMWEVFTCGKMPYGRMKNAEVVDMVQHGRVLEKPRFCPSDVYNVMQQCWNANAENRPSFNEILRMFQDE